MKQNWKLWLFVTVAIFGLLFVLDARVNAKATAPDKGALTYDVSAPVSPVLSVAVRDLAPSTAETFLSRETNPIQWLGDGVGKSGQNLGLDALVGTSTNDGVTPDPYLTFEGVPSLSGVTPPDTNGDVGPNHYIQMTNFHFQIWDKGDPANGIPPTVLAGPISAGTFFAPLGGGCGSEFGDPVVLYDDLADRWLLSQFNLSSLGMCIAVSTTPDPLGTYNMYNIPTPDFPDYPKLGVWPDAYLMGTNTGFPNQYYAHAFDRAAMLAGQPATRQSVGSLANLPMPADVDGQVAPPVGEPAIFYTYYHPDATGHPAGSERIAVFEYDLDWTTPANSTFTTVAELPITAFNYTICGFFAGGCVEQPGTGQLLDDLAWWPMNRFQYRNFGGYATMVGNFTVDADGQNHAGIRWFELHKTGSTYSLYQEGTYAPDTDSRWMGSIAMDLSGNIALGYSVSSDTTIPSIRYATRLAGDPLGTLNAEAEMFTGGGVQTSIHRWGDYSTMSVDPVDGCTFWFTTEYHDVTDSGFGWNTRIGSFRIPSCGGPSGTLTGQVVDSSNSQGIPGAAVQATASITKTGFTTTDANGYYTMTLLEGSYYVTATAYAYLPDFASGVNIVSGTVETANFALDPAQLVVVEGNITDDLMDWPLYAQIEIGGGYPGDPIWTDPVTGYYSVTLPEGSYPFEVSAFVDGYTPQTTVVNVSSVLAADAVTATYCSNTVVTIPDNTPAGVNHSQSVGDSGALTDVNLLLNATHTYVGDLIVTLTHNDTATSVVVLSEPNNGTGGCSGNNLSDIVLDDDGEGTPGTPVQTSCTSGTNPAPAYATNGFYTPNATLTAFDGQDLSGTWTINVSDNAFLDTGTLNNWCLSTTVEATTQTANFSLAADPVACTAPGYTFSSGCNPPASGGLVVGNVYDINTTDPVNGAWVTNETGSLGYAMETPLDPAVDDAFYTVYSLSGSQVHTATYTLYGEDVQTVNVVDFDTVSQDFDLPSGFVVTDPDAFNVTLEIGDSTTLPLNLEDIGGANVEFEISEAPGTNPWGGIHIPASDGNFPRGTYPTSMGPAPTTAPIGNTTVPRATLAELLGSSAYSIDHSNLFYTIFDIDVPEVLPNIGAMPPTGDFIGAGEYVNGLVYMIDTLNVMWEVDPATGAILNTYSATPLSGGETYTAMAYDPTSGVVYAGGSTCATSSLYTIEPDTGVATLVGSMANGGCLVGLAADDAGNLWGYDIIADVLLWIDKSTGNATVIGSIGFDANFGQGMGWDPDTDTLYMAAFNGGTFQPELRAVDRVTGNTTLIGVLGQTDPGSLSQLPWLGFEIAGGDVPWVIESPITGTVPANGSIDVDVTFDAAQVPIPGQYTAYLNIAVDTPQLELTVPLTLNVTCSTCGTLEGEITDEATSLPLVSTIHITSTLGFDFTIEDVTAYNVQLAPGEYYVNASSTGYLSETVTVDITTGNTTTQDFALWANTSILSYSPASVEESLNIGEMVTNTVTVTNTGAAPMDFEVNIGGYSGPFTLVPLTTTPLSPDKANNYTSGKPGKATQLTDLAQSAIQYPATPFVQPEAGGSFVLDQLPNGVNGLFADSGCDLCGTGAQSIADNFVIADTTTIGAINIWSGYFPSDVPITDDLTVIFHQDAAGAPGPVIFTETGVENTRTQTGVVLFGVHEYFHELTLSNAVTLSPGTYWLEIYNASGFGTDDYFWETGDVDPLSGIPGSAWTTATPGSTWNLDPATDLAVQLVEGSASGGWAYAVPEFGTVPPFSSTTFELVFDARSLYSTGDYFAELSFDGSFANDPGAMPLTLHVSCPTCGFLAGDIYDAFTSSPVDADVYISSETGTAITLTGVASYSLALQPGTYDFLVSANGYFSETATVSVEQGQTVVTDFALTPIVAILEYSPFYFERTVSMGQVFTDTLTLSNPGTVAYNFELSDVETGAPGALVAPMAGGILLVDDDDNNPDVQSYYTTVLDAMGLSYDVWDTVGTDTEPDEAYMSAYTTVIWFTGVSFGGTAGPGSAGEAALGAWLDSGACLLISSQDYYYDRGLTTFMGDYLGVASATSDVGQTSVTGTGSLFAGLGPYSLSYPFFNYSDDLTPDGTAEVAFTGDAAPNAAINKTTNSYATTFLGYPFEAIPNVSDQIDVMEAFLTSCLSDAPWLAELPAIGTVAPDASETVEIIFDASVITQTGTYTAELRFDGTYDNSVSNATVVMHVVEGEADVTIGDSTGSGEVGTTVTHTMWITNTGNIADVFTLSVAGNTWNTEVSATTIVLDPGESAYVMCYVDVPVNATEGDTDTATVTVTSSFDDTATDSATATTEAIVPEPPTYQIYLPFVKN